MFLSPVWSPNKSGIIGRFGDRPKLLKARWYRSRDPNTSENLGVLSIELEFLGIKVRSTLWQNLPPISLQLMLL